jgi:hypothetical protein
MMSGQRDFSDITAKDMVIEAGEHLKATLKWGTDFVKNTRAKFSKAQATVDSECLRYMDPLTPLRTGTMIKSATLGTVIGSGEIIYLSPYARRQYYNNKGGSPGHPQARALWFETMKAAHKEDILRAAGKEFKE